MNTLNKIEPNQEFRKPLLCWKSIFAGLFVATLSYLVLASLGMAVGGLTAANIIAQDENASGLAAGVGVWLGISMLLSLFAGSYFTVRASRFVTAKVGVGHGIVVASILFVGMAFATVSGVGTLVSGVTKTAFTAAAGVSVLAQNSMIQDAVQKALGTSNLKSDASVVAQGLITRLLKGDSASATNYLAYQTGETPAQVSARIGTLQAEFDANVKLVAERTAEGVAAAGMTLLATLVIGILAAAGGGFAAARANANVPITRFTTEPAFRGEFAKA